MDLKRYIREIPDYPTPGVGFKDITTLMAHPGALDAAISGLADRVRGKRADMVVAAEARGFLLGPALARELGAGFILARKPGKLPHDTVKAEYQLEYGTDTLEIHSDALDHGARVIVHDDLLATGGTAKAVCELVERLGGEVVGLVFVAELTFLHGRDKLTGYDVRSLVRYDEE
jgi:adenine phosphoribosyltransferase